MAITIGAANFPTLTAQPFGYEETETRAGQTARKWLVTGLLKPSEWLALLDAYDGWQDARIDDIPTETSGVVGTTISFTGDGPGGQSWTSVACWFITAPAAEQLGAYLSVSVELVDANQALAVLLKTEQEEDSALSYGGITIGSASFPTLTAQPFGYEQTETRAGYTARKWLITGTLTPAQWLSLLSAYDEWRDARIEDEPAEVSGVVGTTIAFSGNGPGGQSWTNIACWFIKTPEAEQSGANLSATVELVDANEALEVLLKVKEEEVAANEILSYGGIAIGSSSFPTLTAQPFGYDETDTRAGYTARKWLITGPLTPAQWLSLLSAYDTWRNARIDDEPTEISGVVGTTIGFSGNGPGGQSWSNVPCWFIQAPKAEQSGADLSATVELVDANEALEVILKNREDEEATAGEDLPNLGTITIGGAVLTLLKPADTYAATPTLELTAGGSHYVQGALVPFRVKDVEGTTDSSGWNAVLAWYEGQVSAVPSAGSYFPITAPTATAQNKIISGVTTVQYTVSIQMGFVL